MHNAPVFFKCLDLKMCKTKLLRNFLFWEERICWNKRSSESKLTQHMDCEFSSPILVHLTAWLSDTNIFKSLKEKYSEKQPNVSLYTQISCKNPYLVLEM